MDSSFRLQIYSSETNAQHRAPRAFVCRVSLVTTTARPSRIAARVLPTKTVAGAVLGTASARCRRARCPPNRSAKIPVPNGRRLKRAVQDAANILRADPAWPILSACVLSVFFLPAFAVSVCDLKHFITVTIRSNDCLRCGWCLTSGKCIPGYEEGPCSFSRFQCPALKDVAPYDSKSAFVYNRCPCTFGELPQGEKHLPGAVYCMYSRMSRPRIWSERLALHEVTRLLRRAHTH